MGNWIRVLDHEASVMPSEDSDVWVTRMNAFNEIWVQTIDYHKVDRRFYWDGIVAWMPYQEEKPEPYDCSHYFAGKPRQFKVIEVN